MKHKNAEMIKAKADNMVLVVFENDQHGKDEWYEIGIGKLPVNHRYSYFLCLPQHKEACLHWLNGGDVIIRDYHDDEIERVLLSSGYSNWHEASVFMCERTGIRIKPKKEKRWIAVRKSDHYVESITYLSEESAEEDSPSDYWTHHEIEVEV